MDMNYGWFDPRKPGEMTRKCIECGAEYEPKARNQKRCDKCKGKRVR